MGRKVCGGGGSYLNDARKRKTESKFKPNLKSTKRTVRGITKPPKKPPRLPKHLRRPLQNKSDNVDYPISNPTTSLTPTNTSTLSKDRGERGNGGGGIDSMYLADLMMRIKAKMQGVDPETKEEKKNGVTIAIVGSSGCGKTTMIRKIFLDEVYSDRGENKNKYAVTIFTESPKSDALNDLDEAVAISRNTVDPEIIKYCYQMNLKWDKEYSFVVLLDDCLDIRHKDMIQKMFLTMRNMNVTSMVSLQYIKIIPPSIRTSVYFTFLFNLSVAFFILLAPLLIARDCWVEAFLMAWVCCFDAFWVDLEISLAAFLVISLVSLDDFLIALDCSLEFFLLFCFASSATFLASSTCVAEVCIIASIACSTGSFCSPFLPSKAALVRSCLITI